MRYQRALTLMFRIDSPAAMPGSCFYGPAVKTGFPFLSPAMLYRVPEIFGPALQTAGSRIMAHQEPIHHLQACPYTPS